MLEEQLQAFEVFLEDSVDDDVEHNLNVRCICRRSEVGVDELGWTLVLRQEQVLEEQGGSFNITVGPCNWL